MPAREQVNTDSVQTLTNKVLTGCNVTATGGTTAVTLANFAARELWVEDFGTVGDGVTNDATAINAAIVSVGSAGGGTIHFGSSTYAITATLLNVYNNVRLVGQGGGHSGTDDDAQYASTVIKWTGAAGGTMLTMGPALAAAEASKGGGIIGIYFDGASSAATGVLIRSVLGGEFELAVSETTTVGIDITVDSTITPGNFNTQSNLFEKLLVIQQAASSGIGVRLSNTGAAGGNVSLNHFGFVKILHRDGVGLDVGNSDGNCFDAVSLFRHASGTAIGVLLRAGTTPNYARDNHFGYMQASVGGLTAQGTASGTTTSRNNKIDHYSLDNSTPVPTIEIGAQLNYATNDGFLRSDDIAAGGVLEVHRSSNTNADLIGDVNFAAYNGAGTPIDVIYAFLRGVLTANTSGAETGALRIITKLAGTDTIQAVVGGAGSGWNLGSAPTGGLLGTGSINVQDTYYINGANQGEIQTVTYSASMTPNQRTGAAHIITVTNTTAFTLNNPTNSVAGDVVTIMIKNSSGGTHGDITWDTGYKVATWTKPANGFNRSIQFLYDGTNWIEIARTPADIAN